MIADPWPKTTTLAELGHQSDRWRRVQTVLVLI
jgi:hypothetical protein